MKNIRRFDMLPVRTRSTLAALMLLATWTASPALSAPMTTEEIKELYSDSSSVSSNGKTINYYSPAGNFKSTNIKTGSESTGKWFVTPASEICIQGSELRCWRITQTKRKVCFSADGKTSCRAKNKFFRGDQTSVFVQ